MKTNLKKLFRVGNYLALVILAVSSLAQATRAATADPSAGSSFTWDCISRGAGQKGIAFITFSNNNTFQGFQMWAAPPPNTNTSSDGRGNDTGRGTGNTSGQTNTFVFGFSPISGLWAINTKKQIVGFFSVALNVTSEVTNFHGGTIPVTLTNSQTFETTNIFLSFTNGQALMDTNFAWLNPPPGFTQEYFIPNTNFTVEIGSAEQTNAISFSGTATTGKRLTLVCSTSFGKVTYKGVPISTNMPDLSGPWIGNKHENKQQFNEFFNLVSFSLDNPFAPDFAGIENFPNIYFVTNGLGPAYQLDGVVMASAQKQIGFTFSESAGTNSLLRATIGSLKVNKNGISGNTLGIKEPFSRITFEAVQQP